MESAFWNLDKWAADIWTAYGTRITLEVFKTQLVYCLLILADCNLVIQEKEKDSYYGKYILLFGYGLILLYCAIPPANNRGSIGQVQRDVASTPLLS